MHAEDHTNKEYTLDFSGDLTCIILLEYYFQTWENHLTVKQKGKNQSAKKGLLIVTEKFISLHTQPVPTLSSTHFAFATETAQNKPFSKRRIFWRSSGLTHLHIMNMHSLYIYVQTYIANSL